MDFVVADDESIKKMNAEFDVLLKGKAHALNYITNNADKQSESGDNAFTLPYAILFLYIVLLLRYNNKYGTQIFDADGSMGRLRRNQSVFGSINNLGDYNK